MLARGDGDGAREVAVDVGGAEPLLVLLPARLDAAAPHDAVRFHLEDVGEIAAHRDLELETHMFRAVIGDVEILVHPAADRPADHQAQRARRNDAVLRHDRAVGEEHPRGVIGDTAAVQKLPFLPVGVDRPAADQARVEEIESLFAWRYTSPLGSLTSTVCPWWMAICGGPTCTVNGIALSLTTRRVRGVSTGGYSGAWTSAATVFDPLAFLPHNPGLV